MRIHELKVAALHFPALADGRKRFEYRANDRGFLVGDYLLLREINEFMIYTERWAIFQVEYILDDTWYSMPEKFVCMSLSDPLSAGLTNDGFEAYRPHILPFQQ